MSIRAVIWDFGGVLMRTEDYRPREELAGQLGMTRRELEKAVFESFASEQAELGRFSSNEFWKSVHAELKYPGEDPAKLEELFWSGDRLDTGLVEFIRSLRPAYRTALLSNAYSNLRAYLERDLLIDAFDVVVISAEVGLAKPDPRIFKLVCERLGVPPDDALFVDDFNQNIQAALASGLHALRFQSAEQAKADVLRLLQNP